MSAAAASRVLLIGEGGGWCDAVQQASSQIGRPLDHFATSEAALDHVLRAPSRYSTVFALPAAGVLAEPIAELLSEVHALPTALVELGAEDAPDAGLIHDAICASDRSGDVAWPRLTPAELRDGLYGGCLRAFFQPQIAVATGAVCAVEALARLHHPGRGILYPRQFIPAAMAWSLDRVLTGILAANATLELTGIDLPPEIDIAVNVPVTAVLRDGAVDRGLSLIAVSGARPKRVIVELLETRELPDLRALGRAIEEMTARGFRVAVDDAGPNLPHWRALLDLPVAVVKLDSVLADPGRASEAAAIVEAAKSKNLWVVMEGVETEEEMRHARALGADAVQGFLFGYPMPARILEFWLAQHAARVSAAAV